MTKQSTTTTTKSRKIRKLAMATQGSALGIIAGCTGAYAMTLADSAMPPYLLAIIAITPALTGLLCGLLRRQPPLPSLTSHRTMFVGSFTHMGSLIGLNQFLLRFGLNRGLFQSAAEYKDITQPTQQPLHENKKAIEKQCPTITTITYDIATNTLTSDTIARDRLASTRMALLSMDHTKQIPH